MQQSAIAIKPEWIISVFLEAIKTSRFAIQATHIIHAGSTRNIEIDSENHLLILEDAGRSFTSPSLSQSTRIDRSELIFTHHPRCLPPSV